MLAVFLGRWNDAAGRVALDSTTLINTCCSAYGAWRWRGLPIDSITSPLHILPSDGFKSD